MTTFKKQWFGTLSKCFGIMMLTATTGLSAKESAKPAESIKPLYKNANANIEDRINDLIQRMTLKEKLGQLNQQHPSRSLNPNNKVKGKQVVDPTIGSYLHKNISLAKRNQLQKMTLDRSRLGIPVIFGEDIIHGCRTLYPIPLGQAASFNPNLVKKACQMAAAEASAMGIDWTFSPMVDVSRDPRWGRIAECYGEDPFLNSIFCRASVLGYQGNLSDPRTIAACLKHYVAYGLSEGGRDYKATDVSIRALREVYFPPFKAGVDAGVATIMSAFNDINGTPASCNRFTLTDVLRNEWKFDGFVVSDWCAIEELIKHGVATNKAEAGARAINAGVDMDMIDGCYDQLPAMLKEGKVKMATIDEAVRRILRVKFRLGLFEHPYAEQQVKPFLKPEYLELSRQLAKESIVLLKNNKSVLPLSKNIKSLAVIGPLANDAENTLGVWRGKARNADAVTLLQALKNRIGKTCQIHFAHGCNIMGGTTDGFDDAIKAAQASEAIVVCLGEWWRHTGENGSRSSIKLLGHQEKLVEELAKLGKPIILVLIHGRPIDLHTIAPKVDSILAAWQPGTQGGEAITDILLGDYNPSGKLPVTFPRVVGQIPLYYNHRNSGRPHQGKYKDLKQQGPLYPFGYGLSYTTFKYSHLTADKKELSGDEELLVTVTVKNTGKRDGHETVLWYLRDEVGTYSRPVKELKHFEKQMLKAGESRVFQFKISPKKHLSYPGDDGKPILEDGYYTLMVGDLKLRFYYKAKP